MNRPFVIYTGGFDENVGGLIALHRLCDQLNRQGEKAYLWPFSRPIFDRNRLGRSIRTQIKYRYHLWRKPYLTCEGFQTPLAGIDDILADAVVVYPEIVDGNPLRAARVVRWLLHKPGFHTGKVGFGRDDLFFFFQKSFDDPAWNKNPDHLLQTFFVRDDIYRQTNFGARAGTAYIIRKGKDRSIVHDLKDSILIDGKSHAENAEIFNRVKTCISYDPYTMYSMYAALCGCDSVVIPVEGVSKEEWVPDESGRYGLAYGFDDLDSARQTAPLLLSSLKQQECQVNSTVRDFIVRCNNYYA